MSERAEPLDEGSGELAELPRPRRTLRTVTLAVMTLTTLFAGWLAYRLHSEASFALSDAHAVEVGALASAELSSHENGFVRAQVKLSGKPTIAFSRPLEKVPHYVTLASADAEAGQRWVIYPVPRAVEGPRFLPPELVAGRLVKLGDAGVRFRGLERRLEAAGLGPRDDAWVLVDGEDPRNMAWVLGVEVLLLAFVVFNLLSIGRVARRIR